MAAVFWKRYKKLRSKFHKEGIPIHSCVISYLVCAGGSSTAWEGADPGATTAAVPIVTGKALAGWTAPPWGSWGWTTGMGAIWMICMSKETKKTTDQIQPQYHGQTNDIVRQRQCNQMGTMYKVFSVFTLKLYLTLLPVWAPFWTGRGGATIGNCWAGAGAVRTVAIGTSILPWRTGDCVCTEAKTKHEWAFH